ncbi:hypothetical protein WJX81_000720 [Elliptochloris bilobata]|uniref:TraB domain-containing protein n=1 Tax=Elliptochloris bilobata TaxID=381761 RepID=A0AAW1SG90_9CHLO
MVEADTLLILPRASNYVERRVDGYQEPELVVLFGAVHVSAHSADDVRRVIEAVRPDAVVVELCRSRAALLYSSGDGLLHGRALTALSLSGPSLPAALRRALQLGGRPALLLRALMGRRAGRVAAAAGAIAGAEQRAAREAADACGAQVVLGDRPIEITLERMWAALSWRKRLRLLQVLLLGGADGAVRAEVEAAGAAAADDAFASVVAQLSGSFPEILSPLVHERDLYLAWSCKRSRAVCGARAVVGVLGRAHLRGTAYHLLQESSKLRFRDLVRPLTDR